MRRTCPRCSSSLIIVACRRCAGRGERRRRSTAGHRRRRCSRRRTDTGSARLHDHSRAGDRDRQDRAGDAGDSPRPPSAAHRALRLGPESLRGLLLLPRQADRRPARRPRRASRPDVHRSADPRPLRAAGTMAGSSTHPGCSVSFTAMFLLPLLLLRRRSWLDRFDLAAAPFVRRLVRAVRHRVTSSPPCGCSTRRSCTCSSGC